MLALFTCSVVAFLFDQLTKQVVQSSLAQPFGGRLVRIREVYHREKLFGSASFRAVLMVIWCAAGISAVSLHQAGLLLHTRIALAGVGCALGGAAGNLLDILRRQHIVDFIDLGWWPVFNLADVAIVGGLL